jgi:hypothetical protein
LSGKSGEVMSEFSPVTVVRDRIGTVLVVIASAASLFVAAVLMSADIQNAKALRATKAQATSVTTTGTLLGKNALDGSDWAPADDKKQLTVLFGVAETGRPGNMQFWRDVASRSWKDAPEFQFVGLCLGKQSCSLPPGDETRLTLLTSMDPLQVHALVVNSQQGRAFVFRGSQAVGMLPVQGNSQNFAEKLAEISRSTAKERGT